MIYYVILNLQLGIYIKLDFQLLSHKILNPRKTKWQCSQNLDLNPTCVHKTQTHRGHEPFRIKFFGNTQSWQRWHLIQMHEMILKE